MVEQNRPPAVGIDVRLPYDVRWVLMDSALCGSGIALPVAEVGRFESFPHGTHRIDRH